MADSSQSTISGPAGLLHQDDHSRAKSHDTDAGGTSTGSLSDLKEKIATAQDVVKTKYRIVSESTDDFVHESPWKSVTLALIGGLIIGMLAAR
ncbi:DUF883 domain-containing protein [Paraburkholderia sp. SIMBA_049]